jgi:hypothetical protein
MDFLLQIFAETAFVILARAEKIKTAGVMISDGRSAEFDLNLTVPSCPTQN